jgi:two-component system, cell cycle response regulator
MRILIVDDSAMSRLMLEHSLKKWGYEVVSVDNIDAATELLLNASINFVITDWVMPGGDGPDLCRRIRELNQDFYIYIILVTSLQGSQSLVEGMEAGADDFIHKPIQMDELLARIRAGERVLQLEKTLQERNIKLQELSDSLLEAQIVQKKALAQISYLAHYDSLTGLINRITLKNSFDEALLIAEQQNKQLAVFFIDLDGFKAVNDHFGHNKGDDVLKTTAERLQQSVRENDVVARLGGDEFIVLLPSIKEKQHIISIVEKIMSHLQQTISDAQVCLSVTPSIGIASYPDDGSNYDELLIHADEAMYRAKARGRNQYAFFSANAGK